MRRLEPVRAYLLALAVVGNTAAQASTAKSNIGAAENATLSWQQPSPQSSPDLLSPGQFEIAENCIVNPATKVGQPSQGAPPPTSGCPIDPTKVGGAEDRPIQTAQTERLLYNEFNFSGLFDESSFSSLGETGQFIYAFLPEQGEIFSEVASDYITSSSHHSVISGNDEPASVHRDAYNVTPLLEYAVTDDLTFGAEMTWSSSERIRTEADSRSSLRQDQWHNPTVLANYRVLDQSDEPITAFLRAYYRPAVFADTRNLWGVGGTVLHSGDWFAVSASFDANYLAHYRPGGVWDGSWRDRIALEAAAELSDRWSLAIGTGYSFAFDQPRHGMFFDTFGHQGGAAWVSSGVSYIVVPDHVTASLLAGHQFDSNAEFDTIGDDMHAKLSSLSVDRSSGANIFGLTLTASVSAGDLP